MFSLCSKLEKENVNSLVESTRDLCVSKGILMRKRDGQSPTKTYMCVPCSLLPSPIPKDGFQLLTFLQPHINKLIHDVSQDDEFMSAAFKNVIKVDDFTKRLYDIYKASKASGKKSLDFGILRSDYMFQCIADKSGKELFVPKQIEINTIASGSVKLGSGLSSVHSDVLQYAKIKELTAHLPKNESLSRVAHGFFTAWKDYGNPNAIILILYNENKPNIFDQRAVEYAIYDLDEHIIVRRKTCWELIASIALSPDGKLFVDDEEVAIVYFRVLYTADDYTGEQFWDVRLKVEMSRAILCPSIGYQLAGCKKMQEVLAKPDVLERFIDDVDVVQKLRSTFAGFYELEMNSDGNHAVQMALTNPDLYVLKPQLEGGGNNIYGEHIVTLLCEIGNDERRCAYILMEKICPIPLDNIFVTASGHQKVQAISERGNDVIENYSAGHLLRSKSHEHNDGGISSGLAVLDSPFLV
ncbi:unnamed protein product [Clavelina lepadiformis]|uniref:Glutathione synthetase n=1 Tax=Clavelina lepadiformis TaxID=159417 RepID=A0ABP0G279_CLALP